jgi:hypothetical protein
VRRGGEEGSLEEQELGCTGYFNRISDTEINRRDCYLFYTKLKL